MPAVPVVPPAATRMNAARAAVVLLVMATVAAACGSEGVVPTSADEGTDPARADQPVATGGGDPVPSGQSGTRTQATVLRTRPPAPAGREGGADPGGGNGAVTDPVYAASRRGPGDLARPMLRPAPAGARKIVYQLMVQSGMTPASSSVDHVVAVLRQVSGKSVDVQTVALAPGPDVWASRQLNAHADAHARTTSSGDAAVLNVLFVRGRHEQGESILGVASRADVLTMFPDQYRNLGAGLNPQAIETSLLMHETGHLLGLVGHVVRPDRQDPDHPGHSPNKGSVMYWAVETDDIISAFIGAPPKEFDAEDRADLELIRNG